MTDEVEQECKAAIAVSDRLDTIADLLDLLTERGDMTKALRNKAQKLFRELDDEMDVILAGLIARSVHDQETV